MKLINNLKTLAIAALTGICIWQAEFKEYKVPEGQTLMAQSTYDSITNLEPTIVIDSIPFPVAKWYALPKDTVWVPAEQVNDSIYELKDTLINEELELAFFGRFDVLNYKFDADYTYRLKVPKTIVKTVYQPYPVIEPCPEIKPKSHLYITGGIGGNDESFIPSLGATLLTRKQNYYGLDVSFMGDKKFTQLKLGWKLW